MAKLGRVRAVSTGWTGSPGLNTFYFKQGDGSTFLASDATLCVERVRAAFEQLLNTFPIDWHLNIDGGVDVIEDTDGSLVEALATDPPAQLNGLAISGFQGIALMLLSSYHTGGVVNGHRVSGRSYIGPVAEQQDTNGTPNADQSAKMALFAEELLSTGVSGPDLVVWSRPVDADPLADPPIVGRLGSSHVVTSITTRDFYAVLRSRRD